MFRVRSELKSPVMQLALENVQNESHLASVAVTSDLDITNHHESTVVMVSFNADKVKI